MELGYRHVDLLLLHWPNPLVSFRDTARAMAELRDDGLVRHAGVDMALTAYSPLARGAILDDDVLAEVGERYERTPAQVVLRWVTGFENFLAIPKSASRAHLEENLAAMAFELDERDRERTTRPSLLRSLGLFLRDEITS